MTTRSMTTETLAIAHATVPTTAERGGLVLLGGALLIMQHGAGPWSLDARRRGNERAEARA
jgi:uncharacterized membrane protein YphA (DoxX/SURF4 family)